MKQAILAILLIVMLPAAHAASLQGLTDNNPPIISDIDIDVGQVITITWQTNEPATSAVNYGRTAAVEQNINTSGLVTSHSITFPISPGNTYFYQIESCDANVNCESTSVQTVMTGELFLNVTIPPFVKSNVIDITGTTRAGAEITLYVNGEETRKALTNNGIFAYRSVRIEDVSNITLTATDQGESETKSFNVRVDNKPPTFDVEMPEVVTQGFAQTNISLSEPVFLNVTLESKSPKPERPTGIKLGEITKDHIDLSWNNVSNIREYAVYRNGLRIAITKETKFRDTVLKPETQYQYNVAAISNFCQESELSNTVTATTPRGATETPERKQVKPTCYKKGFEQNVPAGSSTINIDLMPGLNEVILKATDAAGFVSTVQKEVSYDLGPPQFIEHNLQDISPTYDPSIRIKGKVSEKSSVTVFLNGKPEKTELTDENGAFSIPITLKRVINRSADSTTVSMESKLRWVNTVSIQAVDEVGLKTTTDPVEVEWARCGGGKLDVRVSPPLPEMLTPRLLLEGIQEIGLSFNYTYRGGYSAKIQRNMIRVGKADIAPEYADDYDNDLVKVSARPVMRASLRKQATGEGYINIKFNPIENPWKVFDDEEDMPKNATTFDKEEHITFHREGDCLVPGLGCMKLFLELEIPYTEEVPKTTPELTQPGPTTTSNAETHKTCIPIEIPIDYRVPPKYIPEDFLEITKEFLERTIEIIDGVLKPIQTIGQYVFYSCVAGQALSYIPIVLEKYNCEYTQYASIISRDEGSFDPDVAAVGKCEEAYAKQDKAKGNCLSCQKSKRARQVLEYTYKQLCDRVMCPDVPSLQHYIKSRARLDLKEVAGLSSQQSKTYQGSHCTMWARQELGDNRQDISKSKIPPRMFFSKTQIEGIYKDWLQHQSDKADGKDSCAGLQPAKAECCGYEYMNEWSSGCGVSGIGSSLDTFDEIKESTCLSANAVNENTIPSKAGGTEECSNLLNSIGGFCDENGGEPPTTIQATKLCCQEGPKTTGLLATRTAAKDQYLYVLLLPRPARGASKVAWTGDYDIKLGYIGEKIEILRDPKLAKQGQHPINSKVVAIETPPEIQSRFFNAKAIEEYNKKNKPSVSMKDFAAAICEAAGYTGTDAGKCTVKENQATSIYRDVMARIGTPEQEYIIRPGDGLVNSLRCICLPTLIKFLQTWKNILTAVQNCVNTILLTGDGEAGVCQAVISQYACDLLYEGIACFTQKFSISGPRGRLESDILGDVVGSLTSAGTELSRTVEGRYGETNMYKSVFVDKKLVHSVCMFAFTGTWNFDLGAVFDEAVEDVPTESYGLMYPCNRRFVSFNPATQPPGLATWVYHFGAGFAAGSDAELELKLKCSGGYKCKESDGFVRGKCDCEAPEEITISPQELPNNVKSGEIISEEIFYVLAGAPGTGQRRWDTAELTWRWNDGEKIRENKAECSISQTGGAGALPGYCRFDPLTLSFRCQLGEEISGISFIDAKTNYETTIAEGGTFVIGDATTEGDAINVDLAVKQYYPKAEPKYSKFITYVIKNQLGQTIFDLEKQQGALTPFTVNGDYKVNPSNAQHFPAVPRLQKAWFGGAGKTGQQYTASTWSSQQGDTVTPGAALVNNVRITQQGQPLNQQYTFIIELKQQGTEELYKLYDATARRVVDTAGGFKGKGNALPPDQWLPFSKSITYTPQTASVVRPQGTVQYAGATINIEFTQATAGLSAGETRQYLIEYTPQGQAEDPCNPKDGKPKPVPFTITFTAYDADSTGGLTQQKSIDPLTDSYVEKTVTFNGICATKAELASRIAQAKGQVPQQQYAITLAELIRNSISTDSLFVSNQLGSNAYLQVLPASPATSADYPAYDLRNQAGRQRLANDFDILIGRQMKLQQDLRPYLATQITDTGIKAAVQSFNQTLTTEVRNLIAQNTETMQSGNAADIQQILVSKTAESLRNLIQAKQELLTKLGQAAGITTPVTNICPDTNVTDIAGVLDADKNIFTCRDRQAGCLNYEQQVTQTCPGLNVCCKVDKQVSCLAEHDDSDTYEYKCIPADEDATGWEIAGTKLFAGTGGLLPEATEELVPYYCADPRDNCYKKLKKEAQIPADEMCQGIHNFYQYRCSPTKPSDEWQLTDRRRCPSAQLCWKNPQEQDVAGKLARLNSKVVEYQSVINSELQQWTRLSDLPDDQVLAEYSRMGERVGIQRMRNQLIDKLQNAEVEIQEIYRLPIEIETDSGSIVDLLSYREKQLVMPKLLTLIISLQWAQDEIKEPQTFTNPKQIKNYFKETKDKLKILSNRFPEVVEEINNPPTKTTYNRLRYVNFLMERDGQIALQSAELLKILSELTDEEFDELATSAEVRGFIAEVISYYKFSLGEYEFNKLQRNRNIEPLNDQIDAYKAIIDEMEVKEESLQGAIQSGYNKPDWIFVDISDELNRIYLNVLINRPRVAEVLSKTS